MKKSSPDLKLSEEQTVLIKDAIRRRGRKLGAVGKELGYTNNTSFYRALHGQRGLPIDSRRKLYEMLWNGSEFRFLVDFSQSAEEYKSSADGWRELSVAYADLIGIYKWADTSKRTNILNDLQDLTERYRKKD